MPAWPRERVITVWGSVRLTVSEQVRRDHGVGAREDGSYFPPGERVVEQTVHQKEGWTAAGYPIHEPLAVQPHLVACDARKLGSPSRPAARCEFGCVGVSSCRQPRGEQRRAQSGAGHQQPGALEGR